MRHLIIVFFIGLIFACGTLSAGVDDSLEEKVKESILVLHRSQGPGKVNTLWSECGRRLRGEKADKRASEYAKAIVSSVLYVGEKTGEKIDTDHMVAVLFRESSHNECVIGRQETSRLTKELGRPPAKKEIMEHVRKWTTIYFSARRECKKKGKGADRLCIGRIVGAENPNYRGIHGWDLGAAQYRWPGYHFRRRDMSLPSGEVLKRIGLKQVFDYRVSIHMLAEDLAGYKKECRGHTHWKKSKWGKRMSKIDTEDAYFVHHHTGGLSWSERYWKKVNKHLKVIRDSSGVGQYGGNEW